MKNITTRLLTAISLSLLLACEPEIETPEATQPATKITIDLEEEYFLLDGHWYPWMVPIVQCNPEFSVALDWAAARITIEHCPAANTAKLQHIRLQHSTCPDIQVQPLEITASRALLNYTLQLPPQVMTCLRQEDAWLELQLIWE